MMDEENEEKRKPGWPPKPMPPRIDASPEEVVRMLVTPPQDGRRLALPEE